MPHLTLLGQMGNAFKPQRVPQVGQRFPSFPCLAVSLPPPCMASFKDISWSRFGEHSFVRPSASVPSSVPPSVRSHSASDLLIEWKKRRRFDITQCNKVSRQSRHSKEDGRTRTVRRIILRSIVPLNALSPFMLAAYVH